MRRFLPFVALLAGCLETSTYHVRVDWQTTERLPSIPEAEVGARVSYDGGAYGFGTSDWSQGYVGTLAVTVESGTDTTQICVVIQHRTVVEDRYGSSDEYAALSDTECKDVAVDVMYPRGTFELALTPSGA